MKNSPKYKSTTVWSLNHRTASSVCSSSIGCIWILQVLGNGADTTYSCKRNPFLNLLTIIDALNMKYIQASCFFHAFALQLYRGSYNVHECTCIIKFMKRVGEKQKKNVRLAVHFIDFSFATTVRNLIIQKHGC